jgi:hypothetical protein
MNNAQNRRLTPYHRRTLQDFVAKIPPTCPIHEWASLTQRHAPVLIGRPISKRLAYSVVHQVIFDKHLRRQEEHVREVSKILARAGRTGSFGLRLHVALFVVEAGLLVVLLWGWIKA